MIRDKYTELLIEWYFTYILLYILSNLLWINVVSDLLKVSLLEQITGMLFCSDQQKTTTVLRRVTPRTYVLGHTKNFSLSVVTLRNVLINNIELHVLDLMGYDS